MEDLWRQKADAFILVYSVTSEQSFHRLEELYEIICRGRDAEQPVSYLPLIFREIIIIGASHQTYFVVAGNKCDTPKELRLIPQSRGKEFAAKINAPFYSTSAKDNKNIAILFEDCVRQVVGLKSAKRKKSCNLL